ncbi:hypothetical protein XA68_15364 [Ophiocordyceps unilateralis]|uniref:Uncharacterized protein n=1 Tax=Ophiocordyceps unilateralis TaxID=268505 RepID=A0A2A9PLW7_OPHUN|nr:hypothetical protein XA68_15364 [Ophiocordyceps unilateralis]
MARDADDDSAAQSKRPALNHRDTDTAHNTPAHPSRPKPHHQKHHHVGRLHARVPSSKAVSKLGHGPAATKLTRRPNSPPEADTAPQRPAHRRVTSEVKLSSRATAATLSRSASHTSLKRNRSHVEVSKHNRSSSDKLKRTASGSGIHHHRPKTSKSHVHFDLGSEDADEDDWVDASGYNTPHQLSRKASLNSSGQSSLRPVASRPDSPGQQARSCAAPSSPDRETSHHKAYLTSRLLQRTPSQGAPPKMTAHFAQAARPQLSVSNSTDMDVSPPTAPNSDELTSRFVQVSGSALASQGSFSCPTGTAELSDTAALQLSVATATPSRDAIEIGPSTENDDSVLVPRPARRTGALPAETSRVQQKLNLQRASSVLEPGQAVTGVSGGVGASPLIGIGGSSFHGASSRDPRVGKLLERTGMEYLVVRRYQNPVSRSINRLSRTLGWDSNRRTSRGRPSMNGQKAMDSTGRHSRNASTPDTRHAIMTRRPASVRTVGTGASLDGDGVSRLSERLSGPSLVGAEEEDGTTALLRSIWERSMDLGAGAD